MTQTAPPIGADIRPVTRTARVRPWIALAAAAVLFALVMLGLLPFTYAAPVIGVVLALGSPRSALLLVLPCFVVLGWWQGVGELGQAGLHGVVPGGSDFSVPVQFVEFAA